jgi:hypothetical protein
MNINLDRLKKLRLRLVIERNSLIVALAAIPAIETIPSDSLQG